MNQDASLHELEYQFCVDRLTIEIKFPCRITFSVRVGTSHCYSGKQEEFSTESVTLDSGRAEFLKPVTAVGRLFHYEGSYSEKKVQSQLLQCYLTVYVESSSGRNIAGVCTLDLAAYASQQWVTVERQLERCPDRTARISLRVRSALLRELTENPSESGHSEEVTGHWPRTTRNLGSQLPPAFNPDMSRQPKALTSLKLEGLKHTRERSNNSIKPDDLKSSLESSRGKIRTDEGQRTRMISQLKNSVNDKDRKITRLEIEKQSLSKEVEGLRQQLQTFRGQLSGKSSRQIELVGENERLKRKLQSTESSLDILKMKKVEWEKKDNERRQSALLERNLTEEIQAKQQLNNELEKEVKLAKKARQELDRLLREKMRELREALEKNDDLLGAVTTLEKRLEMKQTFYKEEIKKYSEKQSGVEAERQRYWTELNTEKQLSEQKERKAVQTLRDSQKAWFEERSKLSKKAEQLRQELESMTLLQDNYFKQIQQQSEVVERLTKSLAVAEDDRVSLIAELERTKKHLSMEVGYRQKYEEEVREKSALKQQKVVLEKELEQFVTEKTLSHSESSRQLVDRNDALKLANEKLSELNRKLREKEQKVLELQTFLQAQTKKNDLIKKSEEKRETELVESKKAERQLQSQVKELQKLNQELELSLQNSKFKSDHEQEELRKLLKKSLDETEVLRGKLRGQNQQAVKLDESLRVVSEKYTVTLENTSRLEDRLKKLELQLLESSFREKDLKEQLDRTTLSLGENKEAFKRELQKNEENYAKISKLESEYIRLSYVQEQLARAEKQLKERENQLSERRNSETNLELNVQLQQSTMFSLKQELKTKTGELQKEKSITEGLKKDLAVATDSNQNLQRQLQQTSDELVEAKKEIIKWQAEKKSVQEKFAAAVAEHKRYRSTTIESLKGFILALFSGKEPQVGEADFEVVELERQLQRKHRRLLEQQSADTQLCRQHVTEVMKEQLDQTERKYSQIEAQLRNDLETKREEFHYFREGMLVKQDELTRDLQEAQQNLNQALAEVSRLEQSKDELEKEVRRLLLQNEEAIALGDQRKRQLNILASDNKQLEEEILKERRLKEEIFTKIYSEREQTHSQMQEVERALHLQIEILEERLREKEVIVGELSQQIRGLNKQLDQRNETIRAGERELQKAAAANQQLDSKLNNADKKERELLERIRQGEQELQLEQEKHVHTRNSLGIIQVKEKEIEELKVAFDRERETLNQKIQYVEQLIRNSEQSNTRLKQESLQLQEDLSRAHGEIRRLAQLTRNVEEALSKKSLGFDQRASEAAAAKERIQKLEKDLQAKEDSREEITRRLENIITNLKLEKDDLVRRLGQADLELKKQLESKANLLRDFEKQLARNQNENQSLKVKVDELEGSLMSTSTVVGNLNKKEQEMLGDLQHLQQVIHDFEIENGKQHFQLEIRERDLDELLRKIALMEQEQRNQLQLINQRDSQIQELQTKLNGVSRERDSLTSLVGQKEDLARQLATYRGRHGDQEAHQQQLKQQIHSLELALEKYKEDKQFLYRQLKDELERSNILIRQKDEMRQSYELKLNSTSKQSSEEKRNLILVQNDNVQRIARLTSQNNRLDNEVKQLQRKLASVSISSEQTTQLKVAKFEQDIRELAALKAELESALTKQKEQFEEEKIQIEKAYDSQFREFEARRQQEANDHEEKVKRVYKQKFEDEASLRFEIQRLKAELDQVNSGRTSPAIPPLTLNLNLKEYKQEVTEVKMKHYLTQEPLRNIETLLPHIIWLCQENEAIIAKLEGRILQLERSSINRTYISVSKVVQSIKPESELIDKLRQADANCRLTKQRVEEMARDFQLVSEERIKVIGKSREAMDLLNSNGTHQMLVDKISEILDYSRVKPGSRSNPQTPPSSDRGVNIQRVQPGGRVVSAQVWYRDKVTDKLEVRRVHPQSQPPSK